MIVFLFLVFLQGGPPSNASVSGTVIDADRAYPLPLFHARVEIGTEREPLSFVRTDENGRFAFANLPAGKYRLTVTDEGYIRKSTIINLAQSQQRAEVRFAMAAAPTIIGHINDEYGVPVSGILVEAMKVAYGPRGDKSWRTFAASPTDDRGEYHLYWLDPGDYRIRVTTPGRTLSNLAEENQTAALPYPPTYFPGFRDPKDATPIRIRVGSVTNAIDFKLQSLPPVTVAGIVTSERTNEPVGSIVTLEPVGGLDGSRRYTHSLDNLPTVPLRQRGSFAFEGVAPGTYLLSAKTGTDASLWSGSMRIEVSDRTYASVSLKVNPASDAVGEMSVESGRALDYRSVTIGLKSIDSDAGNPHVASVSQTGTFSLKAVPPGDYVLVVRGLPDGVYARKVRSGTTDILEAPLRIDGAEATTIQILLGEDGGTIEGRVLDNGSRLFADVQVVLVPDVTRRNRPDLYFETQSEDDGKFTLHGIPPGEYKLFAWQDIAENAYKDAMFLERYESLGTIVTIPPGGSVSTLIQPIPLD